MLSKALSDELINITSLDEYNEAVVCLKQAWKRIQTVKTFEFKVGQKVEFKGRYNEILAGKIM